MNRRPLVFAALALMAGLWLGRTFLLPWPPALAVAAAGAAGFALAHLRRKPTWRTLSLLALSVALGAARIAPLVRPDLPPNHLSRWLTDRHLPVEGIVVDPPVYRGDGAATFTLEAQKIAFDKREWTRAAGRIALHVRRDLPRLRRGETVRLRTPIQLLTGARTPGAYDASWEPIAQGVYLEGRTPDGDRVERLAPAPWSPLGWVDALRDSLRAAADAAPGWGPWVVRALVLGEQSLVDPLVRDAFYRTGIIHVLVVSGLNIAAVAGLLYLAVWFLLTRWPRRVTLARPHRWAAAVAAPFAVFYALLAGGATSIMRACVMFLILSCALYYGRRRDPLTTLAFAAIVTLLLYPGSLWQAGFQFSFAAVLGMMHWRRAAGWIAGLGRPPAPLPVNPWLDRARRWLLGSFAYSLAAYCATVPIALWHYGQLATAAPIANYVAIPLFTFVAVPFALLGCAASVLSQGAANALWSVSQLAVDQVYGSALLLDALGAGMIEFGRPPVIALPLYCLLFAAVPYLGSRAVRRGAAAGLAALALAPAAQAVWEKSRREFTFTMLDVGQGLSLFVRTPAGRTILIDGGYDPRGRAVTGFLAAQGVTRLDAVVATHPHPDHCNGLQAVLGRYPVGEIWTIGLPRAFAETGPCLFALEQARSRGASLHLLSRTMPPFAWAGLSVEILNPPAEPPSAWELNDRSLALRLRANGAAALAAADMEQPAEELLLAAGGDFRAGVLQVAHHGSLSSSSPPFVAATQPAHALFPVGFQNQYHLPRAEVVERWQAAGARVWRTDLDGAIECRARDGAWDCRSIASPPTNPLLRR